MSDQPDELLTPRLRGERGFTLVEVMVASMIGLVVSSATLAIVIVSVHLGSNYTDRVDANQQGRLAMEKITQALNSSCVTPNQPPILAGSTGTSATFYSGIGDTPGAPPNQVTVSLASTQPAPLEMSTQPLTGTAPAAGLRPAVRHSPSRSCPHGRPIRFGTASPVPVFSGTTRTPRPRS